MPARRVDTTTATLAAAAAAGTAEVGEAVMAEEAAAEEMEAVVAGIKDQKKGGEWECEGDE